MRPIDINIPPFFSISLPPENVPIKNADAFLIYPGENRAGNGDKPNSEPPIYRIPLFWRFLLLPFLMITFLMLQDLSLPLYNSPYRISGQVTAEDALEIETLLQEAEKEFLPLFRIHTDFSIQIYVCRDLNEFLSLTGASSWNGAHFSPGRRTIYLQRLPVLREREVLTITLVHEFLHACIWQLAGQNCPVWLEEGLVLNFSGELPYFDCPEPQVLFSSPLELETYLQQLDREILGKNADQARSAYCRAARITHNLLKQIGFEALRQLLTTLKPGGQKGLNQTLYRWFQQIEKNL